MVNLKIDVTNIGKRFDVVATEMLPILSRAHIHTLIEDKRILLNHKQQKASYKLRDGDEITIDFDIAELHETEPIDLPILYEDGDCLVIDKPSGILTHSKGAFNPEPTVASFIAPKFKGLAGDRAGIVHRLDRATSGVIICAKNPVALSWLQKQFAQRRTKKQYIAVINGEVTPRAAIIDMPIERDPQHPKQFRVGNSGRPAQTEYETIAANKRYSLLILKPITGRTHQLRVHLRQLKHPIVGDKLYGGQEYSRLMLHAKSLEITLPNRVRKIFSSPPPAEFEDIIK